MADYVVNSLDLSKLETQLRLAIEEDEIYKRENAAKFRAIEQSKTYEEFRNIVMASHLKPLDKNESIHAQHIRPASWNICANKNKSTVGCPPITLATDLEPATKEKLDEMLPSELGYHNFSHFWTLFAEDQVGRIKLLEKAFLGENIFKDHDLSIDLFVEILETLNGYVGQDHCLSDETCDLVIKSMQSISSMPRFSLHLLFLSEKERSVIKELKEKVKTHLEEKERQDKLGSGVDMSLAFLDDF